MTGGFPPEDVLPLVRVVCDILLPEALADDADMVQACDGR
jgi:hypothetical protein